LRISEFVPVNTGSVLVFDQLAQLRFSISHSFFSTLSERTPAKYAPSKIFVLNPLQIHRLQPFIAFKPILYHQTPPLCFALPLQSPFSSAHRICAPHPFLPGALFTSP
jgi:hypothetical protein